MLDSREPVNKRALKMSSISYGSEMENGIYNVQQPPPPTYSTATPNSAKQKSTQAQAQTHSPSQEQIPDTSLREAEGRGGAGALDDLEVHQVEDGADQLAPLAGDVAPEPVVAALDHVEPLEARLRRVRRQPVVEELLEGVPLRVRVRVWD